LKSVSPQPSKTSSQFHTELIPSPWTRQSTNRNRTTLRMATVRFLYKL